MTVEVEIVGGPQDGALFILDHPQPIHLFSHPVLDWDYRTDPYLNERVIWPMLTPTGWKLYWRE